MAKNALKGIYVMKNEQKIQVLELLAHEEDQETADRLYNLYNSMYNYKTKKYSQEDYINDLKNIIKGKYKK